jgi:N-methylhydantoinase B
VTLNPGVDGEQLPSKVTQTIRHGDVIRVVVAGGGGHGDAAARAREAVARDIQDELLSPGRAARLYGHPIPALPQEDQRDQSA